MPREASIKNILRRNGGTLALLVAFGLSLGLNVYLLRFGEPPWAPAPPQLLKANDRLPATLTLVTAEGRPVSVSFAASSHPTVLYVLSPLCEWCKRNEKDMKELVAATHDRFRYIGLSTITKGLKQYIADGSAPFPVYYVKSTSLLMKLGVFETPETIVVNPEGKVEQVWAGAYQADNLKKVDAFFGVKLTGVQAVAAAVN